MKFERFSGKQRLLLSWWCENSRYRDRDAVICDGAVRSGKTLCMSISFVLWAFYRFSGRNFAICGKTIKNVRRNIITPLEPVLKSLGFDIELKLQEGLMVVRNGPRVNRFYLYGGRDEGSAALIQGMTLAGALFDEAALMPESFVKQAAARCSVEGAKLWFNCNPENPFHWFYVEWIQKLKEKNALYIHFTMRDNPSLSENVIRRYEKMFTGAFYQRFILGKWVRSEGLVYPFMQFDMFCDRPSGNFDEYALSLDYGTVNPTSAGLWGRRGGAWYRIDEYYFSSREEGYQRTDAEHLTAILGMIHSRRISFCAADPSAASMITLMQRTGMRVIKADNDVINGIREVSDALKSGRIRICRCCRAAIREFALYSWKDSGMKDEVIKENDHAMDDIRYFVRTTEKMSGGPGFAAAVRGR